MKLIKLFSTISIVFCLMGFFHFSLADGDEISFGYSNPVSGGSVTEVLAGILVGIQTLVGWLTVIAIAVGAFFYLTSGGDSNRLSTAKSIISSALVGFVIVVGAPAIVKELRSVTTSSGPTDITSDALPLQTVLTNIMSFLLTVFGTLALISFIISGVAYLSAVGNPQKQETAKKIFLYSIVAVAVATSGIIILNQVTAILAG